MSIEQLLERVANAAETQVQILNALAAAVATAAGPAAAAAAVATQLPAAPPAVTTSAQVPAQAPPSAGTTKKRAAPKEAPPAAAATTTAPVASVATPAAPPSLGIAPVLKAVSDKVIEVANTIDRDSALAILAKRRGVTRCSDLKQEEWQGVLDEALYALDQHAQSKSSQSLI